MTDERGGAQLRVGGYVLAGGRSSRMGRDKALLELGGRPLIENAVMKLRRVCAEVHILAGAEGEHAGLARVGPLVHDLHPSCGPISGIEAALMHTKRDWNLILAVDVPFLPTALLERWLGQVVDRGARGARIALFRVDGVPQPTLLLIHREAAAPIARAVALGEWKLVSALESAARELARKDGRSAGRVLSMLQLDEILRLDGGQTPVRDAEPWRELTAAQIAAQPLWFNNLNTAEDFAVAEANAAALDT
jgi:molybdopterin-guanine dinucleotide biosynthesis protein A